MDISNGMAIEVVVVDVCPDVEMELDVDRWKGNNFELNIFQAFESYGGYDFYDKKSLCRRYDFRSPFRNRIWMADFWVKTFEPKIRHSDSVPKNSSITCHTSSTSFSIQKRINLVSF